MTRLTENLIIYETLLSLLTNENKIFRDSFYNKLSHQYYKSHGMFVNQRTKFMHEFKTIFIFIYHILRALYLVSEKGEFNN